MAWSGRRILRWTPASLGARLVLAAAVVILLAIVLTGAAMDVALTRFIRGQVDGRVDGQIITVADALRVAPDGTLGLERSVDGPPFDRPLSGWYWTVLSPLPVLHSRSLGQAAFSFGRADPGPHGGPSTAEGSGPRDEPLRVRLQQVRVGGIVVTIAASVPLEALRGPLREAMGPLVAILALLGLSLMGGVLLQVRLGLRPLATLRAQLATVRAGRRDRIEGPQPREIGPVVTELNLLLDQNAANLERARRNVANLAHGLKTPLATLSLAFAEQGHAPMRHLSPLVDTMDRLIRHHLARARAAALDGASRTRVGLGSAVTDHVAVFTKLFADKRLSFEKAVSDEVAVACEPQDLDEMLGNLLDNASKWACHRVVLSGEAQGTRFELSVEDDGPGLSSSEAADVLMPGRRIDETTPGYGFGLPITRELAELYGGSLTLSRSALGGLKATLNLPIAA